MRPLLLIVFAIFQHNVHGQADPAGELRELNNRVTETYRLVDFVKAEQYANQAVVLAETAYGAASHEKGLALLNLAIVQKALKKIEPAKLSYERAVEVFLQLPNDGSYDLINAFEGLAHVHFLEGNAGEMIANYSKAVEAATKAFGLGSKQTFSPIFNLAKAYGLLKKYYEADEFYSKSYDLAFRHLGTDSREVREIEDLRVCMGMEKKFSEEGDKRFADIRKKYSHDTSDDSVVVNGKAVKLPRPDYPTDAVKQRIKGKVAVRVTVGENGDVSKGRVVCGHPIFATAVLAAAKRAKFTPTLIDGQAAEVTGIIIYNFR